MNYYKKENEYIASDIDLDLEKVSEQEYNVWQEKQTRIAEILAQLNAIDLEEIRPLAAKASGTATEYDDAKLAECENTKQTLRNELKELNK